MGEHRIHRNGEDWILKCAFLVRSLPVQSSDVDITP